MRIYRPISPLNSRLICTAGLIFTVGHMTSCTTTGKPGDVQKDYVPQIERISSGFRPNAPHYLAEVTYLSCQYLSESELTDIQRNFTGSLNKGAYASHIAAIVVYGSFEPVSTSFGIWLHDGRHLDSGFLFFDNKDSIVPGYSNTNLGRPMHEHAIKLLRKAIPDSKLDRDRRSLGLATAQD
jgi:hypothetical protein